MPILILLPTLYSCGKEEVETQVEPIKCLQSCIERERAKADEDYDVFDYCTAYVLPQNTCYTKDNSTFYYR